jgi:hypothetical protein
MMLFARFEEPNKEATKEVLNYAKPVFMWGIQYPEIPGKR